MKITIARRIHDLEQRNVVTSKEDPVGSIDGKPMGIIELVEYLIKFSREERSRKKQSELNKIAFE